MELLKRQSAPEPDGNPEPPNRASASGFDESPEPSSRASGFNESVDSSSRTSDFNESAEQSGHAPSVGFNESAKASSRASAPGFGGVDKLLTHPFPPVFDENSEILILGSFPSVKSRGEGFFYAHPRNRFWKVMEFIRANRSSGERSFDESVDFFADSAAAGNPADTARGTAQVNLSEKNFADARRSFENAREAHPEAPSMSRGENFCDYVQAAGYKTPSMSRGEKILLLRELRFALWDVCAACSLEGSADSSIKSVVPNDLSPIFSRAKLKGVVTNGKTADALYRRYLLEKTGVEPLCLPSTSPANAAWSDEKLCRVWYDGINRLAGRS